MWLHNSCIDARIELGKELKKNGFVEVNTGFYFDPQRLVSVEFRLINLTKSADLSRVVQFVVNITL